MRAAACEGNRGDHRVRGSLAAHLQPGRLLLPGHAHGPVARRIMPETDRNGEGVKKNPSSDQRILFIQHPEEDASPLPHHPVSSIPKRYRFGMEESQGHLPALDMLSPAIPLQREVIL